MKVFKMFSPVTFISEFVPTDMALKRPLACVSSIVVLKFTSRLKIFLAHIANKSALPRMEFNVPLQKVWTIKTSSAARKLTE